MTKVLIALTGATEWSLKDGSKHFGGVWSPEFCLSARQLHKGRVRDCCCNAWRCLGDCRSASLSLGLQENDPASVDFQRSYLRRPEIVAALARPARLEELDPDEFDVIFVPGGFGVFQDLGDNPVIGKMLAKAHRQQGKIVGAVCSGVSALLGARAEDGSWPFAGKQITGFPNAEMIDFGVALGAPWLPEERLTQAGAKYIPGQKHKDVVVVDGNLITGQNGASAKRTARQVNAVARK